jgi:hypothetical protein
MTPGLLSIRSVMDIYDVKEMFARFPVDPTLAQQNVPSQWTVKIHEDGQARLLVMVQECRKMVLDYVLNVGYVGMSHLWIELEGPEEFVTPLPGTTRSLPTRYWHILPHQLENRVAATLFRLVGVSAQPVGTVSLGGEPGGTRSGQVIEGHDAMYTWTETSSLYPEPDIVTGSQCFYRKVGVRVSEARARCESHFLGDGQVTLTASPDSAIGRLGLGITLSGISNPVLVRHCRARYRVGCF